MFHDIPEGTSLFQGDSEEHRGVSRRYGRTCRGGWEATEKMGWVGLKVVELWKNGGGLSRGTPWYPQILHFLRIFQNHPVILVPPWLWKPPFIKMGNIWEFKLDIETCCYLLTDWRIGKHVIFFCEHNEVGRCWIITLICEASLLGVWLLLGRVVLGTLRDLHMILMYMYIIYRV